MIMKMCRVHIVAFEVRRNVPHNDREGNWLTALGQIRAYMNKILNIRAELTKFLKIKKMNYR